MAASPTANSGEGVGPSASFSDSVNARKVLDDRKAVKKLKLKKIRKSYESSGD